jgi:transposase
VKQESLFQPAPRHRLAALSKEQLIEWSLAQAEVIATFESKVKKLEAEREQARQTVLLINEKYVVLRDIVFGKSSEKESGGDDGNEGATSPKKEKKKRVQLPSERYPNAPIIERHVELQELPPCSCCGKQMEDSGMTEDSEFLTVVPKQYFIVRQMRHKYRCGHCHGDLQTAPGPARIVPGSALSDEMIVDVALSKYCDLIPIDRYSKMAARSGLNDLPPQTLIEGTHNLADFVAGAYVKTKNEAFSSRVLHSDETPHRMLEGDAKSGWQLWGFSNAIAAYFEIRDTRSGDVAAELLSKSQCEYLVSDVFSGYGKAVRDANEVRRAKGLPLVANVYCNAHARRGFKRAKDRFLVEAQFFVEQYKKIYHLNDLSKGRSPPEVLELRAQMIPHFEAMKAASMERLMAYPSKSSIAKAMKYLLKNYAELTLFTKNPELPIDNNPQERLLRNPVIGRKTWYGTHSKRGALTAAILFTLVESCKLNKVNPRAYFKRLIEDLHAGLPSCSPHQFAATQSYPVKTG